MRKAKFFAAAGIMAMSLFTGLTFNTSDVKADEVETVGVTLSSVEGSAGDEVVVNIAVTSNPGTIMAQTKFSYDDSIVTVKKVENKDTVFKCDASKDQTTDFTAPNLEKNPIQLIDGYSTAQGNSKETGDLYAITLEINKDAKVGDTAEISFEGEFLDWEFNSYAVEKTTAKVTVVEKVPPTTVPPTTEPPTTEPPTTEPPTTVPPTEKPTDSGNNGGNSNNNGSNTQNNNAGNNNQTQAPTTATPTTGAKQSPKTGDAAPVAALAVVLMAAAVTAVVAKKKAVD